MPVEKNPDKYKGKTRASIVEENGREAVQVTIQTDLRGNALELLLVKITHACVDCEFQFAMKAYYNPDQIEREWAEFAGAGNAIDVPSEKVANALMIE